MHFDDLSRHMHAHQFAGGSEQESERRTLLVVALTGAMMLAEIVAGIVTGSMALLADGWHMGSHFAALGLAAFAYRFARRHAQDRRFSFGTGKVSPLAAFASAITLGLIAIAMAYESAQRLIDPVAIDFTTALVVAAIGLGVNLASALLLSGHQGHHHHGHDHHGHDHHGHDHHGRGLDDGHKQVEGHAARNAHGDGDHHDHDHDHGHDQHHRHDHNLRAAYVHVLADALTSLLAIVALAGGALLGLRWLDPVMGLVGAAVILWWSWGLVRHSSQVLLDMETSSGRAETIRRTIEADADNRVADLHLWQVGTGHLALIVSVVTHRPRPPEHYKALLARVDSLSHITVEVIPCEAAHRRAA